MKPVLAIDIGGTRAKSGIVSASGQVLSQQAEPTPATLPAMRAWMRKICGAAVTSEIAGIGIGCKGIVNTRTTLVESLPGTLNYLQGHLLSSMLPQGIPVYADNDARVAMEGEMLWGAAKGRSNALMLTLGTGVGGAVLAEGKLLRGATGIAGHLGHLTVNANGPLCICGNRGCLETYFSAPAIEAQAYAAVRRGVPTALAAHATCAEVFAAAAAGDEVASLVLAEAIQILGGAIAGLIHLLDPEVIILGGQIAEAGPQLLKPLRKQFGWRTKKLLRRTVPVLLPKVTSSLAGAAALVLSHS